MTTVNVRFSDPTDQLIIGYFSSPPDSDWYPDVGTVDTSDPRWATYWDTLTPELQQYVPLPD